MDQEKRWQIRKETVIYTLLFGLAAHAYMYFEFSPAHDALQLTVVGNEAFNLPAGRFTIALYFWLVRGYINVPWLIGCFSLLFLGIALCFIFETLHFTQKWTRVLLCGIFATCVTLISANGTYIFESDVYMLAVLCCGIGVYVLERFRYGYIAAMLLFAAATGCFQSYLFVAIGLLLVMGIQKAAEGEPLPKLMRRAGKYVGTLLGSAAVYALIYAIILSTTELRISGGNSSTLNVLKSSPADFLARIPGTYIDFVRFFAAASGYYNRAARVCIGLLALTGGCLWVFYLYKQRLKKGDLAVLAIAAALLPLGLNGIYVLTGFRDDLMSFSCFLMYLLPFIPCEALLEQRSGPVCSDSGKRTLCAYKAAVSVLCGYLVLHSVVYANGAYYYRHLVQEHTDLYMTRIINEIESTENYVDGQTPVAFVGSDVTPAEGQSWFALEMDWLSRSVLAGVWYDYGQYRGELTGISDTSITNHGALRSYFMQRLGLRTNIILDVDMLKDIALKPEVRAMPAFPQKDYCGMVDGVLVVKVS